MNKPTLFFFAALAAGYTFAACNCGGSHQVNTNDGGPGDDGGGNYGGGPGSTWLTGGAHCSTSSGGGLFRPPFGERAVAALTTFAWPSRRVARARGHRSDP